MQALTYFIESVRSRGLVETTALSFKTALAVTRSHLPSQRRLLRAQYRFDQQYGIETTQEVTLGRMGDVLGDKTHAGWYLAGPIDELHGALHGLGIPYPDTTFVDLGAGKGRALFIAAQFAFKKIVGVEFSPNLVQLARRNIGLFSAGRSHPSIEVHCMDASKYEFPCGDLCIYMFNPFDGTVMHPVMENLRRGLAERRVGRVALIYVNPIESELISRYLRLQKRVPRPGVSSYDIYTSA